MSIKEAASLRDIVADTPADHRFSSTTIPPALHSVARSAWRERGTAAGMRLVAAETPVALTYNRATHAVMLATPDDLEDFAVGFSLAEGVVASPADILALDIVVVAKGVECRMDLDPERLATLTRRQRRLAGPSGCGLCGLDSLAGALRPIPPVPVGPILHPNQIQAAMRAMPPEQVLNAATRAAHAAAFWTPDQGLIALREDVGRHNALDKLAGALARNAVAASGGAVLLSSRISVEMVQKAATMGVPILVAVSAPTSLAIQQADMAGLTLIGIARDDGFEVFTHPHRIDTTAPLPPTA